VSEKTVGKFGELGKLGELGELGEQEKTYNFLDT